MKKNWPALVSIGLNLVLIVMLVGMQSSLEGQICRLSSHIYNFTFPNIVLHIGITVTLSTLSWLWTKSKWDESAK